MLQDLNKDNVSFVLQSDRGRAEVKIYTIASFWKAHFLGLPMAWERTITILCCKADHKKQPLPLLYNSAHFFLHLVLS